MEPSTRRSALAPDSLDVMSDVLRTVRLSGALFLHAEFREPWTVAVPPGPELARRVLGDAVRIAVVHYVLEGRCWALSDGLEPTPLEAGQVVVYPHGGAHVMGTGPKGAPASFDHLVDTHIPDVTGLRYGGVGNPCRLACGWFATERDVPNPLVEALPPVFIADIGARPAGAWLEASVRFAVDQRTQRRIGGDVLAEKVAEALFVEALRSYADGLPPEAVGWFAGLRDPVVTRCLGCLHAEPSAEWTLDRLARKVHSSRSVVAKRFTDVVGVPPMTYLTRWRLAAATRLLRQAGLSVAEVATRAGYDSEAAFSRAFKRHYGVAPGRWRQTAAPLPGE